MNNSDLYFHDTSRSRDEAISMMIGWCGSWRWPPAPADAADEEIDACNSMSPFDMQEVMQEQYEQLDSDYFEAIDDKLPMEVIAEKLALLKKHKAFMEAAAEFAPYVDDEIAKLAHGELSALRIDRQFTDRTGIEHYTKLSVKACREKIMRALTSANAAEKLTEPQMMSSDIKPWFQMVPGDPAPEYDWYTPARYFARQLVMEDSTLLTKKNLLAGKVAHMLLKDIGTLKRGKSKPLTPGTVLKAFSKVSLG